MRACIATLSDRQFRRARIATRVRSATPVLRIRLRGAASTVSPRRRRTIDRGRGSRRIDLIARRRFSFHPARIDVVARRRIVARPTRAMDHQSTPSRSRLPFGDLTNTCQRGNRQEEDSNDRRSQRDKERYAVMSREKKDERNRKDRERRRKKKDLANANQLDVTFPIEEDEDDEWLHRGHFTQINNFPDVSVPVDGFDDNEWLHMGQLTQNNDQTAGGEVLSNAETNNNGTDENYIDTTINEGGAWNQRWLRVNDSRGVH